MANEADNLLLLLKSDSNSSFIALLNSQNFPLNETMRSEATVIQLVMQIPCNEVGVVTA